MSKRSSAAAGLPPAAAASGRPTKLANSDLNMMYLSKFETAGVGKLRRDKEDAAWGDIPTEEQKAITNLVTRYCMLKYSSGAGFIEELEVKKLITEKYPLLVAQTIVKPALRSAQQKLRSLIGAELMPVFQTLTADSYKEFMGYVNEAYDDEEQDADTRAAAIAGVDGVGLPRDGARYMLRCDPTVGDDADFATLVASATDGPRPAHLGLLVTVLCMIMVTPDKCIREDVLHDKLREMDGTTFAGKSAAAASEDDGAPGALTTASLGGVPWRDAIRELAAQKWLTRRPVTSDLAAAGMAAVGDGGGSGGAAGGGGGGKSASAAAMRYEYAVGPKSRQTLGIPFLIDTLSFAVGKDIAAAGGKAENVYGVECVGIEPLVKEVKAMEEAEEEEAAAAAAAGSGSARGGKRAGAGAASASSSSNKGSNSGGGKGGKSGKSGRRAADVEDDDDDGPVDGEEDEEEDAAPAKRKGGAGAASGRAKR